MFDSCQRQWGQESRDESAKKICPGCNKWTRLSSRCCDCSSAWPTARPCYECEWPSSRGPRSGPTAAELAAGDWTPAELKSINSMPTRYQKRKRLRLLNNRDARARQRHTINMLQPDDTWITCAHCDMTTVIAQFSFWIGTTTASKCYGDAAPRARMMELETRNKIIAEHNATAAAKSKHTLLPLTVGSSYFQCRICKEKTPLNHGRCSAFYTFRQSSACQRRTQRRLIDILRKLPGPAGTSLQQQPPGCNSHWQLRVDSLFLSLTAYNNELRANVFWRVLIRALSVAGLVKMSCVPDRRESAGALAELLKSVGETFPHPNCQWRF